MINPLYCAHLIAMTLLKLDISRAFDSVSWAFIIEILTHLGFAPIWRNLISSLMFTSSTQVLLNDSPGNRIAHRRGLRQGDPLSPMLFVMVMDVLNSLFRAAESRGLLQSLEEAGVRNRLSIYADDVVLFVKPMVEDLNCVRLILDCFVLDYPSRVCAIPCVMSIIPLCNGPWPSYSPYLIPLPTPD
jgi:hypothetical protein